MSDSKLRKPFLFVAVGAFQYLLDTALYALLISFGIEIAPANIVSRLSAAASGFVLNRYVTFGQRNETVKRFSGSLMRFVLFWVATTVVSTLSIIWLADILGGDNTQRVVAKVIVEAVLAVVSFLVSRYWIFRN